MEEESVGREIKRIRCQAMLNQKEFAEFLNACEPISIQIKAQDISLYESGKVMPPANKYQKILNSPKYCIWTHKLLPETVED